jgi:hypothetical protein
MGGNEMSDLGLYLNNKPVELKESDLGKMGAVVDSVKKALESAGIETMNLNLEGLIAGMKKGVDGCESGCPGDAMRFIREGFPGYSLKYTEGGFIVAERVVNGQRVKMVTYPDADKML